MNRSVSEFLTRRFYEWEIFGRGWLAYDTPVALEPPFRPFYGHHQPELPKDDGRRHTLLSGAIASLSNILSGDRPEEPGVGHEKEARVPSLAVSDEPLAEFCVLLPRDGGCDVDTFEQLALCLSGTGHPVAFEIVGTSKNITLGLTVRESDARFVEAQCRTFFPDVTLSPNSGYMARTWRSCGSAPLIVEFGISDEFMRPFAQPSRGESLGGVFGAMNALRDDEIAVFQVIFSPVRQPWAESMLRSVTASDGRSFFLDTPGMVRLTEEKVSRPLFACVVRLAVKSDDPWALGSIVCGALKTVSHPCGNNLIPLSSDGFDEHAHVSDLLRRESRRCGFIANATELAALAHFPTDAISAPKLVRITKNTKVAPEVVRGAGLVIGENLHGASVVPVALSDEARVRHMHVMGATGTGKSTFLLNLLEQDIHSGAGVALIDPHGDLVTEVLGRIPEHRLDDVVLVDPSDEEYSVGFNLLAAKSDIERNLLSSDLVAIFRRLSTSWGDQMNSVFANALMAVLESERGGTLIDVRRFLVEPAFRAEYLSSVRDEGVVYYWKHEFPMLTGKPQGPILTRLDMFLRPKPIRHMMAQKDSRLNFSDVMNGRKIFLAKLSHGAIGEENAHLLGSLFVAKFHQAAISRQNVPERERPNFFLYADEFHNYVTPSMGLILSGARKYRLGLTLVHQELRQVKSRDSDVLSAILSSAYTRVCFRLGDEDAKDVAAGFSSFDAQDFLNLGTGEAIVRVERSEFDFNLTVPKPQVVSEAVACKTAELVVAKSREKYAKLRSEISVWERAVEASAEPIRAKPATKPAPEPPRPPVAAVSRSEPEIKPPVEAPPPRTIETVPPTAGRGGRQHKYLQQLIKRWAEGMGWRADVEKNVLSGAGSVDVALSKGGTTIACEISVTTSVEHEVENLKKCLSADFTYIASICPEPKHARSVEVATRAALSEQELTRIRFLTTDELFAFVQALDAKSAGTEKTVRGYRVKVAYRPLDRSGFLEKKDAVAKVIAASLRRMKDEA